MAGGIYASPIRGFAFTVISTVFLGVTNIYIPFFGLISTFVWAAPTAVLTVREGVRTGILGVFTAGAFLALFTTPVWAALAAAQFGALGLIMGFLFRKGTHAGQIIITGTVISILTTGLLFFLPFLLSQGQEGLVGTLENSAQEITQLWENTGVMDQLRQQGLDASEIQASIKSAVKWIVRLFPSILVVTAAATAFINFLVARGTLFKAGVPVSSFPAFRRWFLPWYISWGVIFGLGITLLGDYVKNETLLVLGQNILYLHFPVIFTIGLSVIVFFYHKAKSRLLTWVVVFAAIFYLPVTIFLLLLVGVFDPLFDFRKVHFKKNKG